MARQNNTDKSDEAFRELVRVLEDAIHAGAYSVGLEYEDRDLIVYHHFGNTGLGAARIAKELERDVINQIHEWAGLSRKSKGKILLRLLGKDYEVAVKTHDSFGESVYHLTLKEPQGNQEATAQKKKKKKKNASMREPSPLRWEFDPDIPTDDFFESRGLDDLWDLQEAVDNFVHMMDDTFLTWEAVVCEEQGLGLTAKQKKALGELLNFNDEEEEEEDRILYIDEMPRPSEPWHVILNKIVPHLLIEPYRTFDFHEQVKCEGWGQIVDALREHGRYLSRPPGAGSPEEVVPAEIRHKLWLQYCFYSLSGLGQEAELTLEDPKEHDRVDRFIDDLRERKDSVAFFGLTLESLLTRVILQEKDQPTFIKLIQEKLGLKSAQEFLGSRL